MPKLTRLLPLALAAGAVATLAFAQGNDPLAAAVTARKAHMQLYAFNMGVLGGMAQGAIEYDAPRAQAAAANIAALATLDQQGYWLPGTENGVYEGSRAAAAIITAQDDVAARNAALATAAQAAAAATDLAGLQAAMAGIGGACGGCHQAYRVSS
jgi:cytochrome c556